MSKKKKKKLNKKIIQERLQRLEMEAKKEGKPGAKNQPLAKIEIKSKKQTAVQIKPVNDEDKMILRDVKKVALITSIIALIFVALLIVNLKTDYLLMASDKILNFLHVGQL